MSSSTAERTAIAVGLSARALTAALVRCGWWALACDLFLDTDTRALARDAALAPGSLRDGLDTERLVSVLIDLARRNGAENRPLLFSSGFEDRPEALDELARFFPIIGNAAATIAAVKNPAKFAAALHDLEIPHPQTVFEAPGTSDGWLAKRIGGSGGAHVRPAGKGASDAKHLYWQRKVSGQAISLSFVRDGADFLPLGFSEQWCDPVEGAPFRFGGVVQPARIDPLLSTRLEGWARAAAAHFGLRGIGGVDFMVDGEEAWLIEINPRPGATLDLFAGGPTDAMVAHLRGFGLGANNPPDKEHPASALQVIYAGTQIIVPKATSWPGWIADRPAGGTAIGAGEPVCTVFAGAAARDDAIELLERRVVDARRLFC